MVNFIDLFILGLATWRITSILQREKIATPLRQRLGEKYDEILQVNTYADTFFGHLIGCFWCVSVWGGVFSVVLYILFPLALLPFAVSALVILYDKVI